MTIIAPLLFGAGLALSLAVIGSGIGIAIDRLFIDPRGIRTFNGENR